MTRLKLDYKGKLYKIKYHHIRFMNGKIPMTNGGITFASIELDNGKFITEKATCSLQDMFNKKIGRTMAMGRLRKKLESGIDIDKPPTKTTKDMIFDMIFRC